MTDDMGFSDIGCYDGEIDTPNIDALAEDGLRFTQLYNTGRFCPTRAFLMTGLYAHEAGLGGMVDGDNGPVYYPFLNKQCVTILLLGVRMLEGGEVYIRARDPASATPGPDEAQEF